MAGAYEYVDNGTDLVVPVGERDLFEDVDRYWSEVNNRWHIYRFQPGPQVLVSPLPVKRAVSEGDVIEWEGYRIRVLDTPGATMGAVSYLVEVEGKTYCFSGDVLYGPGQVWNTYSLTSPGYKGILGNRPLLKTSLDKLDKSGASKLIPSHGDVMDNPSEATQLTADRIDEAWLLFSAISSLRIRTPARTDDGIDDPRRMPPVQVVEMVQFVRRIPHTTYLIRSKAGAVFMVDCGADNIVSELQRQGVNNIEGIWVTHIHDDHIGGLAQLYSRYRCPIIADEHYAEILEHPRRFILPCIHNEGVPVARVTTHGESWKWKEFTMTAYHFPGQTQYHGGLLVEGRGERFFFSGDSFSHYGVDNDTPANRNFLGKGRGHRKCIDVLREANPDIILHSHFDFTWRFTSEQLDYMDSILAKQEQQYALLLPWEDPNFGTDTGWVRAYPYEQDVFRGCDGVFEMRFTNHAGSPAKATVEPVLPDGWTWYTLQGNPSVTIPAGVDGGARMVFTVPVMPQPDYISFLLGSPGTDDISARSGMHIFM
ncbi:MBL fold metallo-hydrolase [Candidatus Latescibacterota bacterium]